MKLLEPQRSQTDVPRLATIKIENPRQQFLMAKYARKGGQPKKDCAVDPEELIRFLEPRMAYFMVPRYVETVEALPKTPTGKIQKFALREMGVTAKTWDREAAGVTLQR